MANKLYRIRQSFTYPGNQKSYVENTTDALSDWHPDDIQAALGSLIELTNPVATPAPSKAEELQPPAKGTRELTEE